MSRIRSGKHCEIKVVDLDEHRKYISCGDAEMDARAQKAIKVAIDKAKICKKPMAKYDLEAKRAYLEYADDIVATTGMSNEDATLFADERRYASIAAREDFTFETVLSSEYKLEILEKAKSEGYFIKCIYVLTIDPYINVARVETRVALGGHNVETDKIIKGITSRQII